MRSTPTRLPAGVPAPWPQRWLARHRRGMDLLVVGLVLALVNSLIKPVAKFVAFPLYVLTFGLFALVVNGAMLMLTSAITDRLVGVGAEAGVTLGLHVGSFGTAVLGSIVVSIVSALVVGVLGSRERDD